MNLHSLALIPESYVRDADMRLSLSKRIAVADSDSELDELKIEMVDRFGDMPIALSNLLRMSKIKLFATEVGIKRIDVGPVKGRVEFTNDTTVDPLALVKLVRESPETYNLMDGNRLRVNRILETESARFKFVEKFLSDLRPKSLSPQKMT